jgi:hypothetical protein
MIRTILALLLAPAMKLTGFRFSKAYRRGDTQFHAVIFNLVDTVSANMKAGI